MTSSCIILFTKIGMDNSYISSHPDIMGGEPVIKGTRVPIDRIKFLILQDFSLGAIKSMYPHVPKKTLKIVIDEIFKSALKSIKHDKKSA